MENNKSSEWGEVVEKAWNLLLGNKYLNLHLLSILLTFWIFHFYESSGPKGGGSGLPSCQWGVGKRVGTLHSTDTSTKRGWTGLAFLVQHETISGKGGTGWEEYEMELAYHNGSQDHDARLLTKGNWKKKDRLFGPTREAHDRRIDIWMNSSTKNGIKLHNSVRTIVDMKTNFGKKDIDGRLDQ
ncbi:hypothetical protein L1987_53905 [Smallanthus sonchifolius]|uniref:Uncharacterized protein n=1 Tax=Smallanthus sonchifolius TaxID=185202 RepID=A0ACB9E5N5_9ASTR|nr:hypothetical protein L1987_53905 [Smallanthus sonchifolius]